MSKNLSFSFVKLIYIYKKKHYKLWTKFINDHFKILLNPFIIYLYSRPRKTLSLNLESNNISQLI